MQIVQTVMRSCPPLARLRTEIGWRRRMRDDAVLRTCVEQCLPRGLAVDVGASEGLYALAMRARVGASGRVLAIEPNPASFRALLSRTWKAGIDARPVAVSNSAQERTTLSVPTSPDSVAANRGLGSLRHVDAAAEHYEVTAMTLDDLLSEVPAYPQTLVKIDVEGWEYEVLQGAQSTLSLRRPALVVEIEERHLVDRDHSGIDVLDFMLRLGYSAWGIDPNGGRIPAEDFDFGRHQSIDPSGLPVSMRAYVNNFLFLPQ